ncbi:RNA polymerase sigma factor RpoE [Minicystis rosea]|nr:RNA polymerase sigma factor RpoE [Minicystis rosea]
MTERSTSSGAEKASGGSLPAAGDERLLSFKEVYDEHFRFVWRSLRRLGVPESDVADAVQDVFLVVHRRLGEFEGRSKVTTWLYGISYRVAHDRRRLAHVRRRADDDEGHLDERADENADVAAAAERRQGLAMLEAILDDLPMDQRAVFTLFELDGVGGEAIAEMLEIPLGTVYSRLRLAREQFKKALARLQARDRFRMAPEGVSGTMAIGAPRRAGVGGDR